jgi:hypothetical protein
MCRISRIAIPTEKPEQGSAGGNSEMRAKLPLREHLLATKMKKWAIIGRCPSAYPNSSLSRARRNYARLVARYPELARRLGMTAISAYPPL